MSKIPSQPPKEIQLTPPNRRTTAKEITKKQIEIVKINITASIGKVETTKKNVQIAVITKDKRKLSMWELMLDSAEQELVGLRNKLRELQKFENSPLNKNSSESTEANDVSLVVLDMINRYCRKPEQINNGDCDIFAKSLHSKLKRLKTVQVDGYADHGCEIIVKRSKIAKSAAVSKKSIEKLKLDHCWVYDPKSKKHYDAETPDGVKKIADLPWFKRKIVGGAK